MVEVGCCAHARRRVDTVPLQDIADRLVRDSVAEIGECPEDTIVTPTRIFPRHFYQGLQLWIDPRSSGVAPVLGAIELAGNQFPIPSQNCIGLGFAGQLGQGFPPEALADLSE